MISLKKYRELLEAHEWFYEMFEDTIAWCTAKEEDIKLRRMSKQSEAHLELFNEIRDEKTQLVENFSYICE